MGLRGPKPKAEGLALTRKGYVRRYHAPSKRLRMEHVLVWEAANGPVPAGFQVHHKNEIKTDNRLENLELLTALDHKREHSGCFKTENGTWMKPCRTCGETKPLETEFYKNGGRPSSYCKACWKTRVTSEKRARRARRAEGNRSAQ